MGNANTGVSDNESSLADLKDKKTWDLSAREKADTRKSVRGDQPAFRQQTGRPTTTENQGTASGLQTNIDEPAYYFQKAIQE